MTIVLNGSSGITTPDVTSDGLTVDSTTLVVDEVNNRVGVGTSSPDGNLHLYADGASLDIQTSVNTNYQKLRFKGSGGAVAGQISGLGGAAGVAFYQGTTEAARIDSSGNLLVGTTSNQSAVPARIDVLYNGASTYGANFKTSHSSGIACSFLNSSGTQVGKITTVASSTSYSTSSDYRLKEDWQPMTGASERVKALKPVNFAWKADGSRVDGFLAHEAQAVVPEAVTGVKDAVDADGNPEYQGIDQSKLVPLLTAALQEALAEIDDLTARVSALEATNV